MVPENHHYKYIYISPPVLTPKVSHRLVLLAFLLTALSNSVLVLTARDSGGGFSVGNRPSWKSIVYAPAGTREHA